MKSGRLKFFLIINIIILISGLLFSIYFAAASKKYTLQNTVFIYPKISSYENFFSKKDINDMENIHAGRVSYEYLEEKSLAKDGVSQSAKIYYVNHNYFQNRYQNIVAGSGWSNEMKSNRVMVVNESLAWSLFGSVDVLGHKISLEGYPYEIVGVLHDGKPHKDNCNAWIPHNTNDINEKKIQNVFLNFENYNPINAYIDSENTLKSLGKSSESYKIIDMNNYVKNIEFRYKILFFLIGVISITYILKSFFKFRKYNINKTTDKIFLFLVFITIFAFIFYIWKTVKFSFWIPNFSDNKINNIYINLFNSELLPAKDYMTSNLAALKELNKNSSICFISSLVALINIATLK